MSLHKYHYFYKITNLINDKYYYGIHSTNDLNDGYMGSGKALKAAIKKYGVENFRKDILKFFSSLEELSEFEKFIVNEDLVNDSNCYNLVSAYFNNCSTIGEDAFAWCGLKTLSFPAAREIGYYAFAGNPMSSVSMWQVYSINQMAFAYCSILASASFQWCKSIGSSAFLRCSRLSVLRLMSSAVCSLLNSNAFSSTPFAGYSTYFSGTPIIYVPSSLLASYKTATNWSYYSKYFSGV